MAILSCAIDLLVIHGEGHELSERARPGTFLSSSCILGRFRTPSALATVKNYFMMFMPVYHFWAVGIQSKSPGKRTDREKNLLHGLKRGAHDHWRQSLRTLEAEKHRLKEASRALSLWKDFGALFGHNSGRKGEHVASTIQRCTRRECEHNGQLRKGQLLRCKGCGAHYCGRQCQTT